MRNHDIGQWILSRITTPERAASIVGDLIESRCDAIRFWTAIGSHLLHAVTPKVLGIALAGFVAQFVILAIPAALLGIGALAVRLPMYALHWYAVFACAATQLAIGYWFGRSHQNGALLICLIIGLLDCALGFLGINNASINMAIWSIPLLPCAILSRRGFLHRLRLGVS